MIWKPYKYQLYTVQQIIDNKVILADGSRAAVPLLEMGLGKTVSTLTAISHLLQVGEVRKVMVVAPKKVVENVWKQEAEKWDHLKHLRVSLVTGTENRRKMALKADAEVYCISRDNLAWLRGQYNGKKWVFDMLVLDELSSYKNQASIRFKSLKSIRPAVKRIVGLTGTPKPNGLPDMWPQMFLMDRGERLGKTLTEFRNEYLVPDKRNADTIFSYKVRDNKDALLGEVDAYERQIMNKISDIAFSMTAADYLELPPYNEQIVEIPMPAPLLEGYQTFEKDLVLQLPEGEQITAINAAVLTQKLMQYASGAIYLPDKSVTEIHDLKIETLQEDMEQADGDPVLCFFWFQHSRDRIIRDLKQYKPRVLETAKDMEDWNAGKIPLALLHPQSGGHGLNLQQGGRRLIWFDTFWSTELFLQARARVMRQGQTRPVFSRRYAVAGTIDIDAIDRLDNREASQAAMMRALKARIELYTKNPG